MKAGVRAAWLAFALAGPPVAAAHAQPLLTEPIVFGDGHVTIGGNLSATLGTDDPGYFNYTDYDHSALRLMRVHVSATIRGIGNRVAIVAELQTENFDGVRPYALYGRIRPWKTRAFDIAVGRVPPTFGAFARRTYASDNPLIGYPLAYQYLTTVRPDAVPASADELLGRRGRGWLVRYSLGNQSADRGMPLVSAFRWDTGVQLRAATAGGLVSGTASVTTGTVSNPLFSDDNSGRQIAARLQVQPLAGLIAGASAARGPFVSTAAARGAVGDGHDREFTQTAWGADVEFSRDYYIVRLETIVSDWRLPIVRLPALTLPLRAVATSVEGRYKIKPGLYAALRVDHLGFSDITGTRTTAPWDAPVTRTEIGAGYAILRNLTAKLAYQYNVRSGGPLKPREHQLATQLVFWF